jgi:hypothetical protein
VRQLDSGQGAAGVDGVRDPGQRGPVIVVPQAQLDKGGDVGARVNLHLLGTDDSPAALGLDVAHGRLCGGITVTHAVAVRHLEEPVLGANRPQLNRLE